MAGKRTTLDTIKPVVGQNPKVGNMPIDNPLGISPNPTAQAFLRNAGGSKEAGHNLSNQIFPMSFIRAKEDLQSCAEAIIQAETASYPFRVKLQKMYEKTVMNPHVAACIQRRMELTLLRDFEIQNANGECDDKWTSYFKAAWFKQNALVHILNAQYHGFSLISIGELMNGMPVNEKLINIKRWNISPDRKQVAFSEYSPSGYSWDEEPFKDWHIWIPTLQTNGINNCGYGLLFVISIMEILQRNNVQYNTDFIEMFAQPYRWLKTNDLEGDEFDAKQKQMDAMGHAGYLITSLQDELEFMTDGARGNGYKAYNDFDHRIKSDISKYIGGHADFIDSAGGKMIGTDNKGSGEATDSATGNSEVQRATAAKRMIDGDFCTNVVNELLIPKLQNLGIGIPKGHVIKFLNDSEERAIVAAEASKNQVWATLALTMAQGGLKMDDKFFTKTTGVPCTSIDIMPDKNVLKDPKEQAAGKGTLKDSSKARIDKPKHTK